MLIQGGLRCLGGMGAHSELAAVGDCNFCLGLAAGAAVALYCFDEFLALDDLAKHNVLTIEPFGGSCTDEELRSVGVGSSVGH